MIPLTFLYDEYIDRPKLSEQKKPIPLPTSGVGTIFDGHIPLGRSTRLEVVAKFEFCALVNLIFAHILGQYGVHNRRSDSEASRAQ